MNNAVNAAALAVNAAVAARDALHAAVLALAPVDGGGRAALHVAWVAADAAVEAADVSLDEAIGGESINWAPGMCEAIVAGV